MNLVQSEYNSENLIFWKAVDRMKQRKEFDRQSGVKMFNTFIQIGSTLQVSLESAWTNHADFSRD